LNLSVSEEGFDQKKKMGERKKPGVESTRSAMRGIPGVRGGTKTKFGGDR